MSGNQCKTSKPYHSFPLIAQLILWKRNVAFSETEIPTMASGANGLASPLSGYLVPEGQIGRGAGGGAPDIPRQTYTVNQSIVLLR